MPNSVLMIDDDNSLLQVTEYQLKEAGYEVFTASDAYRGHEILTNQQIDIVLTDLNMPGMDGHQLIKKIRKTMPQIPIIVITAYGSLDNAIKTTQSGVNDYLTKPFSIEALLFSIQKNIQLKKLNAENIALKKQLYDKYNPENIIGQSAAMKNLRALIEKVAQSEANVLIRGESGTGKELIARAMHSKSSRKDNPFIPINCASIPANLMESELFGHTKGSFTGAIKDSAGKFEVAQNGSIFFDEIGDLQIDLQGKLLRVIQEREIQRVGENKLRPVNARVLAATHRDLEQMVAQGSFRQDLFYRLNVVPVIAPPLREHAEDIPLLLNHFIQKLEPPKRFVLSDEAMAALTNHSWLGNIRELENLVERLSILHPDQIIGIENLPIQQPTLPESGEQFTIMLPKDGIALHDIEKRVIEISLQRNNYNQSKAAEFLKVPRHILLYRIKKLGIKVFKKSG